MTTPSRPSARSPSVQKLRRNVQVQRHYRAGQYQMPRGYSQRRWSYGERLPSSYYARNYWISNFLLYSLFAPPSGFVWVRVGNDAFLIDRFDGEIIQARYNVFY
ncbi:RcnB family protein [Sphingomonas sp.]|uniref:RcnB family protein n=1 Tax=Sphingomonas sp. TaxID=28214 RepID=UPI0025F0D2D1|nr:RcnB family protein [Sphingomonas sp.]